MMVTQPEAARLEAQLLAHPDFAHLRVDPETGLAGVKPAPAVEAGAAGGAAE